jgi:hypothetical protein
MPTTTTVVPIYEPKPVIQGDGSKYQWFNCTCASGATHLDRDTEGGYVSSGKRVRELTGDTEGGTSIDQVDGALGVGWPPRDHMDTRWHEAFDDACYEVASGRGAEIAVSYDAFVGTAYPNGCPGFEGNHALFWNAVRLVLYSNGRINYSLSKAKIWDPLWDGRRSGIPGYTSNGPVLAFRWISLALLRKGAGALRMANGQRLGAGLCYVGYTRVTGPADTVPVDPHIDYGENGMIVSGGLMLTSRHVVSVKKGQSFYRSPKVGSDVVSKSSADHDYDYFGYGAVGWYAVLIKTSNFADKIARAVIVYCPRTAGPVSAKA